MLKQSAIAATALALMLFAAPAFAGSCPKIMKEFDAALAKSKAGGEMLSKAKTLRAEGEKLHKAGKHKESVAALQEALKIVGM